MSQYTWNNLQNQTSRSFVCGYCSNPLASDKGYGTSSAPQSIIYICHYCGKPSFFDAVTSQQTPGAAYGDAVQYIDDRTVSDLYNEARKTHSVGCYTASVLCCRKLLMHIAVAKGAEKDSNFAAYVDFLVEKHYIPPDSKSWVDHIRVKGNEANHEINIMTREEAESLIIFVQMLLKLIYEFPAVMKKSIPAVPNNGS